VLFSDAFEPSKRFQFGRSGLDDAFGSELVMLPMRLRVQLFAGTSFDDDPQARATFGIWDGRDALIFVRELY
jgi:hypothetical protein